MFWAALLSGFMVIILLVPEETAHWVFRLGDLTPNRCLLMAPAVNHECVCAEIAADVFGTLLISAWHCCMIISHF